MGSVMEHSQEFESVLLRLCNVAKHLKKARIEQNLTPSPFSLAVFSDPAAKITDETLMLVGKHADNAVFMFRHYNDPDRKRIGHLFCDKARRAGIGFMVAGDIPLALELGADGVHLPEWQAMQSSAEALDNTGLISVACHSLAALKTAENLNADFAFLSPLLRTKSHEHAVPLGVDGFNRIANGTRLPVLALGGINLSTLDKLKKTSAAGFGAIRAFCED